MLGYANPTSAIASGYSVTLTAANPETPTTIDYAPTDEPRLRGADGTPATQFQINVE
jgi:hypothetical protein